MFTHIFLGGGRKNSDIEYLHFMEGGFPMDCLQIRKAKPEVIPI